MTILSSHFPYNLTTGTFHKCVVYDIDTISEAEGNGAESVTEPDTESGQRINLGCWKISIRAFAFRILMVAWNLTNKVSSCSAAKMV